MPYCSNCGAKLSKEANFCPNCGKPSNVSGDDSNRKEKYVGVVLKCPNCGGVISESTVVCPDCGFEITGKSAVSSVQEFANQLMNIELKRKGGVFKAITSLTNTVDVVDNQKLALIQSFPIPNTIDDIKEFIFLSISNIDVKLSKQSFGSKFSNAMNSNKDRQIQKAISDAWVSKMQQAYQKAKVSFSDHPVFESIENVYLEKLRELNIK